MNALQATNFCYVLLSHIAVWCCSSLLLSELDVPEVIGRECVAMTRLQRQAADAFGVLETAQANLVSTWTSVVG
jgi:hypothetical protein